MLSANKVNDAKDTFIGKINFRKLQNLLKNSFEKVESSRNKEIVLMLGDTGAGKSTFTNYLLGCKFKEITDDDGDDHIKPLGEVYAEMGDSCKSQTLWPQVYGNSEQKEQDQILICDGPGFDDNRGEEERISISLTLQATINLAEHVKAVVVVIESSSFESKRGEGIRKISEMLGKLFLRHEGIEKSIFFVISKPTEKTKIPRILKKISDLSDFIKEKISEMDKAGSVGNKRYDEEIIDEINSLNAAFGMLNLMKENPKNIFLGDIFDNGENKDNIIAHLKKATFIPKSCFNFSKYDASRLTFNNLVYEVLGEGKNAVYRKNNTPALIEACEQRKEEIIKNIDFYKKEINSLESGKKVDHSGDIEILKKKISHAEVLEKACLSELKACDVEYGALKKELDTVDSNSEVSYWSDSVDDKRSFWGFGLTRTRKTFSYSGIPFSSVKVDYRNKSEFSVKEKDEANGKYRSHYESRRGSDGYARVEVYVLKKNTPESRAKIEDLQKKIILVEAKKQKFSEDHFSIKKDLETFLNAIKFLSDFSQENEESIKRQIEGWKSGCRELESKLSSFDEKIKDYKKDLFEVEKIFYKNLTFYKVISEISSIVDFDSSLVEEFRSEFNALSQNKPSSYSASLDKATLKEFECPITGQLMDDPVTTSGCGHSFERTAIAGWIGQDEKKDCPCCRKQISKKDLYANRSLKQAIDSWMRKENEVKVSPSIGFFSPPKSLVSSSVMSSQSQESEFLANLIFERNQLEMEMDKVRRAHEKITKKISLFETFQHLLKSAETVNDNGVVSLVFDNPQVFQKIKEGFKEFFIAEIKGEDDFQGQPPEENGENKISLSFSDYLKLMGSHPNEQLSSPKTTLG